MNLKAPSWCWALAPLAVFWALCGYVIVSIIQQNGHLAYPLDDPYIHMAMAKHWAQDGFFGVSNAGFSATSSSPGWTMLIGLIFAAVGPNEWVPLVLALISGSMLILLFFEYSAQWGLSRAESAWWTIVALLAMPLVTMACTGMEHPLHILLIVALGKLSSGSIQRDEADHFNIKLFGLAALASLIRYETVFILFPLCILWMVRGKWKQSASLAAGGFLPIVALGLIYMQQGWYFFPNSILLKSALNAPVSERIFSIATRMKHQLLEADHLFLPFVALSMRYGYLLTKGKQNQIDGILSFTFILATIAHCAFATIGWFFRYEGYLLAVMVCAVLSFYPEWKNGFQQIWKPGAGFAETALKRCFAALLILWVIMPYSENALSFLQVAPGAKSIHEQQYQMGLFVHRFYDGETVVANDIGAINFLADIDCLDMVGLGSVEPVRASKKFQFHDGFVESWAKLRNAKIAILYFSWYRQTIPSSWARVADWTIEEKATVGDPTVTFFAVAEGEALPLLDNLKRFEPLLPPGVRVRYFQ